MIYDEIISPLVSEGEGETPAEGETPVETDEEKTDEEKTDEEKTDEEKTDETPAEGENV